MKLLMSDRGLLFILSVIIVLASLGIAGWLAATDQALSFDGLFLLFTCLVLAFGFGLYAAYLVKITMKEIEAAQAPQPAKSPAPAQSKAASAPAGQKRAATERSEKPVEAEN